MSIIDADAHVVESEHTWGLHGTGRPEVPPDGGQADRRGRRRVLVHRRQDPGTRADRHDRPGAGRGGRPYRPRDVDAQETREMENVEARLKHMDELGIDVQVLYPTIFIEQVTDKPSVEIPLCKSYNRWLTDLHSRGNGRLRWICVLPLLDMSTALEELEYCKQNGACGVFMRPIEGHRLLTDPYFYPLYEKVSELDMAVGRARRQRQPAGTGSRLPVQRRRQLLEVPHPGHRHVPLGDNGRNPHDFPQAPVPLGRGRRPLGAVRGQGPAAPLGRAEQDLPDNILKEYRQYVSCQTDDDVDYVLRYSGEDNIVIGTDYGHNDQSTEIEALRNLKELGQHHRAAVREDRDAEPEGAVRAAVGGGRLPLETANCALAKLRGNQRQIAHWTLGHGHVGKAAAEPTHGRQTVFRGDGGQGCAPGEPPSPQPA